MKYLFFSIIMVFSECDKPSHSTEGNQAAVPTKSDSTTQAEFIRFVNRFQPNQINFSKSINDSIKQFDLNEVFLKRPEQEKKWVVSMLLLKQYIYHLNYFHQSYDLLTMRDGKGGEIINEFFSIAKIQKDKMEMVSSGVIYKFAAQDPKLSNDLAIRKLLSEVEIIEKDIKNK